ncbi:MAG: DNA-processing protein DprA, partial [Phycisphaerales bacterium]|nr:DNA-processing protein DprA [Phycisphaerales bacterium]
PVAIVGSRRCTAYGVEQAERFAGALVSAGLTIVSGGARGVDTAAHRAALRARGHTIAILGCGLARCYPPENRALFDDIVAAGGAVVSELPLRTEPAAANFPARNRIISGMSLGVIAIEAPERSGALITARIAIEEHGREVFAVPGRIDSPASRGVNRLIREGGAALVTGPRDVIDDLRTVAEHLHTGTHVARYGPPDRETARVESVPASQRVLPPLSEVQRWILGCVQAPRTVHELLELASVPPEEVLPEITTLELLHLLTRTGSHLHATVSLDSAAT